MARPDDVPQHSVSERSVSERSVSERSVSERLVELTGGDPFAEARAASERHQGDHGCGLHNAGAPVMQLVASLVRVAGATRIVDLGCGLGYSTLWLAHAAGASAHVIAIDHDADHIAQARELALAAGLDANIQFVVGNVADVLPTLDGPFDFIHDDAWFADQPDHLDHALALLPAGGTLTMANWFLLVDALSGQLTNDWERFAGSAWDRRTLAYAEALAVRSDVEVNFVTRPPLGILTKSKQIATSSCEPPISSGSREPPDS